MTPSDAHPECSPTETSTGTSTESTAPCGDEAGTWSPERPHPSAHLPRLPDGWRLDDAPHQKHSLEHGYWWAITPTGHRVAWNDPTNEKNASNMLCPLCRADPDTQPDCLECKGRGRVDAIPYAPRRWDEIVDHLYVGGIHCQFGAAGAEDGNCLPGETFSTVVSMLHAPGYEPAPHVEHHTYRIPDADLSPDDHAALDDLAALVADRVAHQSPTLVRCQAGLNRSALVAAMALIRLGWDPEDAIVRIREARSPYALFNSSFVAHLRSYQPAP